jgi:transposase
LSKVQSFEMIPNLAGFNLKIMSLQGKELTLDMKMMVVRLKQYFDAERAAGPVVLTKDAAGRTANALGIGKVTVKRIMAEYNKNNQQIVAQNNKPRGKPSYLISPNLQPIIREHIRSENLLGQHVSIEKVKNYLAECHNAEIATTTPWRALQRWRFTYGVGKRRTSLRERDDVILARLEYLRVKRANRNHDGTLKRPEVYLDETYTNKNHSNKFTWYLDEEGPWVNKPSGKVPRWIIVHAITKDGLVNGAELVFKSKKRTGDYHGPMYTTKFL